MSCRNCGRAAPCFSFGLDHVSRPKLSPEMRAPMVDAHARLLFGISHDSCPRVRGNDDDAWICGSCTGGKLPLLCFENSNMAGQVFHVDSLSQVGWILVPFGGWAWRALCVELYLPRSPFRPGWDRGGGGAGPPAIGTARRESHSPRPAPTAPCRSCCS